jgi:transposase
MSKRRSYDVDFKKMIVNLYENGHSVKTLSEEHGIAEQTIYKWIKKYTTDKSTGYSQELKFRTLIRPWKAYRLKVNQRDQTVLYA